MDTIEIKYDNTVVCVCVCVCSRGASSEMACIATKRWKQQAPTHQAT